MDNKHNSFNDFVRKMQGIEYPFPSSVRDMIEDEIHHNWPGEYYVKWIKNESGYSSNPKLIFKNEKEAMWWKLKNN